MLEPAHSSKIEYCIYVQVEEHCKGDGMNQVELNFMENLEGKKGNRALGVK